MAAIEGITVCHRPSSHIEFQLFVKLTMPLADRLGEIVEVIIPPSKTAVQSPQSALDPSIRDRHIAGRLFRAQ